MDGNLVKQPEEFPLQLSLTSYRLRAKGCTAWLVHVSTVRSVYLQAKHLEYSVIDILEKAGASDHIPRFARNRISIETMLTLSDADMKQVMVGLWRK